MFPHVEAFLRNYRLTGQTMNHLQPNSPINNIIRGSPNSNPHRFGNSEGGGILEEIQEAEEEMEVKRGKRIHPSIQVHRLCSSNVYAQPRPSPCLLSTFMCADTNSTASVHRQDLLDESKRISGLPGISGHQSSSLPSNLN